MSASGILTHIAPKEGIFYVRSWRITYYTPYSVSPVRANNRRSVAFVNAQFLAQKAVFSYDLRGFLLICCF
jgi:hypothetical protein